MNKKKLIITGSIIAIIIIIIDQFLKYIVSKNNYVQNTGIAFGIAQNNTLIILIINIIILSLIMLFILKKTLKTNLIIPLFIILAGGFSNLLDRIFRGYVIDFIDIQIVKFPNFNVADIAVVLGILYLIIYVLKQKSKIDIQ